MLVFNHIGLVTSEKKQDEFYYAPNKVWITDSERHPYKIEWLRYEDDTPVKIRSGPSLISVMWWIASKMRRKDYNYCWALW